MVVRSQQDYLTRPLDTHELVATSKGEQMRIYPESRGDVRYDYYARMDAEPISRALSDIRATDQEITSAVRSAAGLPLCDR